MHPRENTHRATITLELPASLSTRAVNESLRAAGVPVNDRCQVEAGFLFVRWHRQTHSMVFRWFAQTPGQKEAAAADEVVPELHAQPGLALDRDSVRTVLPT